MSNIESLWKDYNTYGQNINALVAKKMIDDGNKECIIPILITKKLKIPQLSEEWFTKCKVMLEGFYRETEPL